MDSIVDAAGDSDHTATAVVGHALDAALEAAALIVAIANPPTGEVWGSCLGALGSLAQGAGRAGWAHLNCPLRKSNRGKGE